jgi:hypothetical protein
MKKVAFLHVFKSGGTSVGDWLSEMVGYPGFVPSNPEDFRRRRDESMAHKLVRGHFYARDAQVVLSDRFVFTLIREPEAHMLSVLWHLHSRRRDRITGTQHVAYSPGQYFGLLREAIRRDVGFRSLQAKYFYVTDQGADTSQRAVRSALQGLAQFNVVGLTERLEDSLRIVAWRMRWPAPRNVGKIRLTGAGQSGLPLPIAMLQRKWLRVDRVIYAEATRRFESDFDSLVVHAGGISRVDDFLDQRAAKRCRLSHPDELSLARTHEPDGP